MKKLFDISHLQHIDDYPIEYREREILHYIDNHGYLTTKALRAIIQEQKQAYQLMRTLIKKQYILTSKVHAERGSIWWLSDIGKTFRKIRNPHFLERTEIDDYESIGDKKILSTAHTTDCTLIEIKLREMMDKNQINMTRFISDRYLHKHFQALYKEVMYFTGGTVRVADGEFYLDDKAIAFEVELSQKKEERYRKIYDFFKEYTRYEKVYWFYRDDKIRDKVQELFQKFHEEDLTLSQNRSIELDTLNRYNDLHVFISLSTFLDSGF